MSGGCGFIGINLVNELSRQGADITVMDLPNADWSRLPDGTRKTRVDIMDRIELSRVFDKYTIIYHLAARTDIDGKKLSDYALNYIGTENLLTAGIKSGALDRFVFYSTQLVTGLFNEARFLDETEPYKTKTVYGQSKIEGEKVVKKLCEKSGVGYTIIRPTSVYGPWGESPYREFFSAIKNARYVHVGKAANLVSWVYVKNLVNLTLLTSVTKEASNETYFGNDFHPYTMREIVDTIAAYYGVKIKTVPGVIMTLAAYFLGIFKSIGFKVPIYPFRLNNIKATYCYSVEKSVRIGYAPKYSLAGGVKETLDWYEKKGRL